jgi:hypothetical protein
VKTLEDVDYCAPLTCTSIHDNQIGPCDVQKKFEIGPADGSYQSLGKKSRSARSIVSPIHRNPFRFPVVVNIFLNLIRVIFGSRPLLGILRIYRTQSNTRQSTNRAFSAIDYALTIFRFAHRDVGRRPVGGLFPSQSRTLCQYVVVLFDLKIEYDSLQQRFSLVVSSRPVQSRFGERFSGGPE